MASSPHHIDYDEDELDKSYDPGGESDAFDHDFEISDSEYANFQYETNDHAITNVEEAGLHTLLVGEEVGGEGNLIGYISQSSCHSLNTGSDSDGVSYHMVNEFDRDRHMDRPVMSVGLLFKSVNNLRMALKQYAIRNSFDVKFVKNHKSRIAAVCSESSCEWRLHVSGLQDRHSLQIKKVKRHAYMLEC
ncbi:hypothetical protein AAC387_Pa04g2782 [Persea americana]